LPVVAEDGAPEAGAVGLVGGAVGAGFVEEVADDERARSLRGGAAEGSVEFDAAVFEVDVGGDVDFAADGGGGGDVAGGAEGLGGEELMPVVLLGVSPCGEVGGVFGGAGEVGCEEGFGGDGRDDVDDAAEGAGAVEVGASAGGEGDGFDGFGWKFRPVNPAAEGVVEGDAGGEDERAAGGGGAESAERDALAGGVGDPGAGAPEEFEARVLAEAFV
jgi:hypothetical protein